MRTARPGWPYNKNYQCREGGERLKKRRETCITKACLDYLKVLENGRQITWCQRMNSGAILTSYGGRQRLIKLCRPGTADIYVRLNNGRTVWIENKMPKKGLEVVQKEFKARMEAIGDTYVVVRNIQELQQALQFTVGKDYCVPGEKVTFTCVGGGGHAERRRR